MSTPTQPAVDILSVIEQLDPEAIQTQLDEAKERVRKLETLRAVLKKSRGQNPRAAGGRRHGGPTIRNRLVEYLEKNPGPATNKEIGAALGITGSGVSSALTTNPDLFKRTDEGWSLTQNADK